MGLKYNPKSAIEYLLKLAIYTLCTQSGLDPESAEIFSTIGSGATIGGLTYEKVEQLPETKLYKMVEKNLSKILKEKKIYYKSKRVKEFLLYFLDINQLESFLYDNGTFDNLVATFLVYFPIDIVQAEDVISTLIRSMESEAKKDADVLVLDTNFVVHKLWDSMKINFVTKKDLLARQKFLYQEAIYGNSAHTLEKLFVPYAITYQFKDQREEYTSCWDFFDNYNYFGDNRLLLMLGDYGAGKSSTLKMMIGRQKESFLYIPLIDVLTYANDIKSGICEYCKRKYNLPFRLDQEEHNVRYVLLLDGFDELQQLSEEKELLYFKQIKGLTDYNNLSIVLSSRSTTYIKRVNITIYPQVYLNDFTEEQVSKWIKKWQLVNEHKNVKITLEGLRERKLISVASNKLILYMTARIFEDELEEVKPYSKAHIYKLFIDWTISGKFKEDNTIQITDPKEYQKYRMILRDIAFIMTSKNVDIIKYDELKEYIQEFQNDEVDAFLFEIQVYLFRQHFFTLEKNRQDYISFSHKSFRQYLVAEKIYEYYADFLKCGEENFAIWYQLGNYKRIEIETFEFLEDYLVCMDDKDLEKINKQSLMKTSLFMDSKQFMKLLIQNENKKIFDLGNSYKRSVILSTLSAVVNAISAHELFKRKKKYMQINPDNIFKLCNMHIKALERFFLRNYSVFTHFTKHIEFKDYETINLRYHFMQGVYVVMQSCLISNAFFCVFETMKIFLSDTTIRHSEISDCKFKNGIMRCVTFSYCSFAKVSFENITFKNVLFGITDKVDIIFINCKFEECYFENIIIDKALYNHDYFHINRVTGSIRELLVENILDDKCENVE
ncbi:MAG: hypothetical protein HDR06_20220 [Lachnospiraceae bacterium]|nr:hypothetical protein [Lachnospiraceae bacterium]